MADFLQMLFTSTFSFIVLFIISKLMGKKQIAQLDFVDYVVGISIGSIAAQMAIDSEIPYYHFVTAMVIYLILDLIITYSSKKSVKLRKLFKGKPLILIYNGKLIYENIKKSKLDLNDFLAMCRKKDFFNINDIAYCVFETNGELSILPKSYAAPIVCGDMNITKTQEELSKDFVMDGKIIESSLKQKGKTKQWLYERLKLKSIKNIDDILLASYDKTNDDLIVYLKKDGYQNEKTQYKTL